MLVASNDMKYWQYYYYSVSPSLLFYTTAPATHLFSHNFSGALQFASSSSSAREELQCCAAPENMSAKNVLCSS